MPAGGLLDIGNFTIRSILYNWIKLLNEKTKTNNDITQTNLLTGLLERKLIKNNDTREIFKL